MEEELQYMLNHDPMEISPVVSLDVNHMTATRLVRMFTWEKISTISGSLWIGVG